jgi:KDO2-lipid IV(A) lauroyltransferase
VTAKDRLEAPHRRLESGSRTWRVIDRARERLAILGFRMGSWVVGHLPTPLSRFVIARGSQLAYLVWPTKRRWSNANFAQVLGLPPGDRRVRTTALKAYAEYSKYVVEVMRLPTMGKAEADRAVVSADLDKVEPAWRGAKGGLIIALAHLGNAELAAAGVASRGWPISVLADDSAYPELFEAFRRTRAIWGITIIPWRKVREVYGVLRRKEMLGLFVDWGYRPDGIPVKFFGAWTTFPAGPAMLAAKTGSRILPTAIRRLPDGKTLTVELGEPFDVEGSDPATQLAATQRLADEIARSIAAAPHQWYSFKPLWPEDPAAQAELAARAASMAAGVMPTAAGDGVDLARTVDPAPVEPAPA